MRHKAYRRQHNILIYNISETGVVRARGYRYISIKNNLLAELYFSIVSILHIGKSDTCKAEDKYEYTICVSIIFRLRNAVSCWCLFERNVKPSGCGRGSQ